MLKRLTHQLKRISDWTTSDKGRTFVDGGMSLLLLCLTIPLISKHEPVGATLLMILSVAYAFAAGVDLVRWLVVGSYADLAASQRKYITALETKVDDLYEQIDVLHDDRTPFEDLEFS